MKRKLLFTLALIFVFACTLTLSVSAERSSSNEFGEVTTIQGMTTLLSDKASRVVLLNGDGTYTTYYTYYIAPTLQWQGTSQYSFDELNSKTGEKYTMNSIVRIEIMTDSTVLNNNGGTFQNLTNIIEVRFPSGTQITSISGQQFKSSSLQKINIPASLTSFDGINIFEDCKSLTDITFDTGFSMTSLPNQMFNGCTALESIRIPNSVTELGASFFVNCSSLKEIYLGSGVTDVGNTFLAMTPQNVRIYASECFLSNLSEIGTNFFSWASNEPKNATLFWEGDYSSAQSLVNRANHVPLKNAMLVEWNNETDDEYYSSLNSSDTWTIVYNYSTCLAYYGSHDIPSVPSVYFDGDSFISSCKLGGKCTREGCDEQIIHSTLDALFSFAGFSKSTYNGAIMQSFFVNRSLLSEYEALFGQLSFGSLVAVERNLNGNLYNSATGKFASGVLTLSFSDQSYDVFEVKLSGLKNFPSTRVYVCGYIIANGQIYYLHNGTSDTKPTTITYSSIN